MCQVDKQSDNAVIRIINDTGAKINQFDFAVIGGVFCGVANLDSEDGEALELTVEDGLQVLTDNIGAALFAGAQAEEVFWNDTTKEFTDTSAVGLFLVGHTITGKDSNGNILFDKLRRPVEITA